MEDCIFCKIIKGEIPCQKVYEDETTFAFLDIQPIHPGHILVIPKIHEPEFQNLDAETYDALMDTVKKISKRVAKKINPKRVGMFVAGWDVPHAHVHVVPMYENHDITSKSFIDGTRAHPTNEELDKTAKLLQDD